MTMPSKSWIILIVTVLFASACWAQGLESGNLIGIHVVTVTLNPGVTMDQFKNAFVHDVLPEYEKNWPGLKGYLLKGFFDEHKDRFAIVWLFKTVADRNRNFDANGRANELERAALEKVKPFEDKLKKTYGSYTVKYTNEDDWVVQ